MADGDKRLNVVLSKELYSEAVSASARETLKAGEPVSMTEFVRRAVEDRVLKYSE